MTTDRLEDSRTPTTIELLRKAMAIASDNVRVALPGKVEKYNPVTQRADILPLIKDPLVFEDGEEDTEDLPIIPEVKIMFPHAGGYFLSFPVQKGDNVLLVFNDRSIDNYLESTGTVVVDPQDLRSHDLTDAVAFVGFEPLAKGIKDVIAAGMAMGADGGTQIRITDAGTVDVTSGGLPAAVGGFVSLATKVDAIIALLDGVFRGWTPAPNDGGAALKAAFSTAFPTAPLPTESTNLKAD